MRINKKTALIIIKLILFNNLIFSQDDCGSQIESPKCHFGELTYLSKISNNSNFELVWEDQFNNLEFNFDYQNTSDWNIIEGPDGDDSFTQKKVWYRSTAENVIESNGTLKLKARKHDNPLYKTWQYGGNTYTSSFKYTSGHIYTRNEFGPYGKYEVRAKLPANSAGLWPAFWTYSGFSGAGGQPWNEIDIFDNMQNGEQEYMFGPGYDNDNDGCVDGCRNHTKDVPDLSKWHIYTCIYTPCKMEFYIDNVLLKTLYTYATIEGKEVPCGDLAEGYYLRRKSFPKDPMTIRLNLAVRSNNDAPSESESYPQYLEIDYVRYYKLNNCSGPEIAIQPNGAPLECITFEANKITVTNNYVPSDCSTTFKAGRAIHLKQPYFHAKEDSKFNAYIQCNDVHLKTNLRKINEISNPSNYLTNKDLKIYPNPNKGKFSIELSNNWDLNTTTINLHDITGIHIKTIDVTTKKEYIDLPDIGFGLYFITVTDGSMSKTSKIIIN